MRIITQADIRAFEQELYLNEKSRATVNKYVRAVEKLSEYMKGDKITKSRMLEYREQLQTQNKAQTVNGALSGINAFFRFMGWQDCRVKFLKIQHQAFLAEDRELSEAEYKRLLSAAKKQGNERLYLLMMTVCGTGIRISELAYITVEAVKAGRAEVRMKGKSRTIILQRELCGRLLRYARKNQITEGYVFCTRSGKALDRSNVCHEMKRLCKAAEVDPHKVFPHNLRHLFARAFYAVEYNLAHLADVLGHSRIETTRIYVAVSAAAHEKILNKMKLVI